MMFWLEQLCKLLALICLWGAVIIVFKLIGWL